MAAKLFRRLKDRNAAASTASATTPSTSLPEWDRSTLHSYQYEPLKDEEIRLLVILPGKPDSDIRCQIKHVPIAEPGSYGAISYVWGDARVSRLIYIDGKFVQVTRNLWLIFDRLRRLNYPTAEYVVWADAVCINQQDNAEKAKQILLMPQIYPSAQRVLCWLGEDDGTVASAFACLGTWYDAQGDEQLRTQLMSRYSVAGPAWKPDRQTGIEIDALKALFERPYWKRAWILQEPVFTKHETHPMLLSGLHDVSWNVFRMACLQLFTTVQSAELFGLSVHHILPILRVYESTVNDARLTLLIPAAARRESSKVVDKLFSLHGIAARKGLSYPNPNYDWSVETAFIVYTRGTIITDRTLDLLNHAARPRSGENFPSWTIKPHLMQSERANILKGSVISMFGNTPQFYPLLEEQPSDDPILRLRGVCCDRVAKVYIIASFLKRLQLRQDTWDVAVSRVEEFAGLIGLPGKNAMTGESNVTAVLRTLLADFFFIDRTIPLDASSHFGVRQLLYHAYAHHTRAETTAVPSTAEALFQYLDDHFDFREAQNRKDVDRLPPKLHDWLDRQVTEQLQVNMQVRGDQRCLVVTEKGYLGLAPAECAAGDEIAGLFGGKTPFLLRPAHSQQYELIGEIYVHGPGVDGQGPELATTSQVYAVI